MGPVFFQKSWAFWGANGYVVGCNRGGPKRCKIVAVTWLESNLVLYVEMVVALANRSVEKDYPPPLNGRKQ